MFPIPATYDNLKRLLSYGLMPVVESEYHPEMILEGITPSPPNPNYSWFQCYSSHAQIRDSISIADIKDPQITSIYGSMLTPNTKRYEEGDRVRWIETGGEAEIVVQNTYDRYGVKYLDGTYDVVAHQHLMPVLEEKKEPMSIWELAQLQDQLSGTSPFTPSLVKTIKKMAEEYEAGQEQVWDQDSRSWVLKRDL